MHLSISKRKLVNTTPFSIVYYVTLCEGYIQMTFFPGIPKWEFQNWDFYCPKTTDIHIFLKSSLFGAYNGNIL